MQFYKTYFYPFVKEDAFRFSSFMGSIGGLIGLFAGISLISVVEVLYHVLNAIVATIRDNMYLNRIKPAWTVQKKDVYVNRDHVLYQFMKFVRNFFNKSDFHGLHYTTDKATSAFGRVFWVIVMLLAGICCSLLVSDTVINSELNPIEFAVDEKIWTASDVSFTNNVLKYIFQHDASFLRE